MYLCIHTQWLFEQILESYGGYLADAGQIEKAIEALKQAVLKRPDAGYQKYMCLGQLLPEKQAYGAYKRGVEILERDLEIRQEKGDDDNVHLLSSQLGSALCSYVDQYHLATK